MKQRRWIPLVAGLFAGTMVCCALIFCLTVGIVALPTPGVTQTPVAVITQPPPATTLPPATPMVVTTPTTALPAERTIAVTALAYNATRIEGSAQRAQVIIRPKSDNIVRVGFLERAAVGIGTMWRSAAWTATTAAALMLGVDLSAYDIAFDTGAELIDGPSASGLMTVAVLAGLLGDDVRADSAMTGTINPDGTIGPVGGVPQKIEGAAREGKKLVVVPIVNRMSLDSKSKKTVDVIEWGRNLGVEVRPVSTVYEAYEILTGKKLPRPTGTTRAALSSKASAQFTTATNTLLTRYNQEMQRFNAQPENIRQTRADSSQEAAQSAQTAAKYLAQGLPEIAFQHAFEALSTAVVLNASARLDQLYVKSDYSGMVNQVQTAENALPLDAVLGRLKAQTPRTATDAIALMDAYSDQAAVFALAVEGDLLLASVAKAIPTGKPSDEWLDTLYRANGDFASASVYLELTDLLLKTYLGFGQASAPSEARAAMMAEILQRAAEANLAYFESILDDNARSLGVDATKLRNAVLNSDGDYRSAKFSLVGIPFAAQRLGAGPQTSLMKLGSSLNAYAYSAVLIAKYYSLDAQIDKDGTLTGFGKPQGLIDMLSLADQNSASLLSLVQAEEPVPALFYYNNARFFREGTAAQKAIALFYFWQAAAESEVLANFAQMYAQAIQKDLAASGRVVSPLLAWGWRAPSLPPVTPLPTVRPTVAPPPTAAPSPTTAAGCPPLPAPVTRPSGIIASVTMALDTAGDLKEPVNPTTVFPPNATFHAVVRIQNAPANTRFKIAWYATDVGDTAPCNTSIDTVELTTDGTRNIDFTLKPAAVWPAGTYRVEIFVNGVLDRVVSFSVAQAAAPSTSPVPSPSPTLVKPTVAPPTATQPQPTSECGVIPAGMGGLLVVNYYGQEMNYDIGGKLYKIPGNGRQAIHLAPGKHNYSADIPGVGRAGGSVEIQQGGCVVQSWAAR